MLIGGRKKMKRGRRRESGKREVGKEVDSPRARFRSQNPFPDPRALGIRARAEEEESRAPLPLLSPSFTSNRIRGRDRIAARLLPLPLSIPFRFFLPPDVYRRSRALCFRRFIFCPSAKYPPRRAAISGHDDQREKRAAPTPRFKLVVVVVVVGSETGAFRFFQR